MSWYESYYKNTFLDNSLIKKYKKNINNTENTYDVESNEIMNKINKYNLKSINLSFNKLTSLILLDEELKIIKLLSKYILQNNNLDYSFFFKSLEIILIISNILSKRLKLKPIEHQIKNFNNNIPRCSYKFCNFKNECFYNYNKKTKHVCYQDHYVHNMVSADIIILIEYIKFKFNKNKEIIPNKEIIKSINTLSFVIEHMYSELKSKCLYLKDNEIEKEHYIKNTNLS